MKPTKAEAQALFDAAWEDPLAKRSGDVFHELGERVVRHLLPESREAVVDLFRDWMVQANGTRALFAVEMAEQFRLVELLSDISAFDARIRRGDVFLPYYSEWTSRAMESLSMVDR
jgi:hypothetical protein